MLSNKVNKETWQSWEQKFRQNSICHPKTPQKRQTKKLENNFNKSRIQNTLQDQTMSVSKASQRPRSRSIDRRMIKGFSIFFESAATRPTKLVHSERGKLKSNSCTNEKWCAAFRVPFREWESFTFLCRFTWCSAELFREDVLHAKPEEG